MAKLFLVDGSNHAFRVHFALPPMHDATGFPTRALYGFTTLLAKLVRTHQPDYVVVSFDSGKTFRHDLYPDYKGHRPDMPEDLRQQWPFLPQLVEAFGYKTLAVSGFEADDVLGACAIQFASPDLDVMLITGDHDYYQLVGPNIRVLDLMKDEEIGPDEVRAKLGMGPESVIDIKALSGDTSDNIPGIPGVGEKTAVKYLTKYGDLEGVLANWKDIGGKKGEAVRDNAEAARLSKVLATIRTDFDLGITLADLKPRGMQEDVLRPMFDKWDFGKVARKLLPDQNSVSNEHYRLIQNAAEFADVEAELRRSPWVSVNPVLFNGRATHVAWSWSATSAAAVPMSDPALAERVFALLADPSVPKVAHDVKALTRWLADERQAGAGFVGDTLLLDYVMAAHEKGHSLEELASRYLGHTLMAAASSGALPFARPPEETARLANEAANVTWILHDRLDKRMDSGSRRVYSDIEVPLASVLGEMERAGISVALDRLDGIRTDIDARLVLAEQKCHEAAGRVFSVNSRHEIADVLFGEGSPYPSTVSKKLKDGHFSTDSSILEKIADGTNLPSAVLEYRQLQKLKGTYVDKLPTYVGSDGRIHTTLNQAVAATGRLSSQDPNLQNIPIRTFEGRRIRDCFVPAPGHVFLSADYSQIELRILAHVTDEPALIKSFLADEDIHRRTASEVFGIPLEDITPADRNAAKAINFGLMYGMSAFRLANDLKISRDEAEKYMRDYFGRMPRIQEWVEKTKREAKQAGFVETMFGRRRVLTTIHSANKNEVASAEREAINTPVQGAAADIIKLAMLAVDRMLKSSRSKARLILQVHDELLLEVPEGELAELQPKLVAAMENAAELKAPLRVNAAVGLTWNQAHG